MTLSFGGFALDQERRQLLRAGRPVALEPKAYGLLSLLVERRPRALSRAQIRDVVWPGVFISESTLGVVVNSIRQALDDDARQPRFVRTVHGFGYAFCGEARANTEGRGERISRAFQDDLQAARPAVDEAERRGADDGAGTAAARRALPWVAAGALTIAVAFAAGRPLSRPAPEAPAPPLKITPLTTDGGFKEWPQLSPDGERVAYSWEGPNGGNWDVYVKAVGNGTWPLRLTEHSASDWSPVWSPDGRQIAFMREFDNGGAVYTVPSLGGQERRLANVTGPLGVFSSLRALSWAPDGKWLAFAEKASEDQPAHVVRLSLETLEREPLTTPPEHSLGDHSPALSPEGALVAFVRSRAMDGRHSDVWVQPVEGGQPRQLTHGSYDECHSLAWTPTGKVVVFTASFPQRVFRVSLEGGDPQLVPGPGENAASASFRGNRMVYLQVTATNCDIWRVPGRASRRKRVPEKLITSSQAQAEAVCSPDGRRIAFESNRSGIHTVWLCDADGSHPVQLTGLEDAGTPRWSPDGRSIVFDSLDTGDYNLYVVEPDGGIPRRLTPESSDDYRGAWSRDGHWIYFASNRSGRPQIWKLPVEGGQAVQVTQGGGVYADVSGDDTHLYFTRVDRRAKGARGWEVERRSRCCRHRSPTTTIGPCPGVVCTMRPRRREAPDGWIPSIGREPRRSTRSRFSLLTRAR